MSTQEPSYTGTANVIDALDKRLGDPSCEEAIHRSIIDYSPRVLGDTEEQRAAMFVLSAELDSLIEHRNEKFAGATIANTLFRHHHLERAAKKRAAELGQRVFEALNETGARMQLENLNVAVHSVWAADHWHHYPPNIQEEVLTAALLHDIKEETRYLPRDFLEAVDRRMPWRRLPEESRHFIALVNSAADLNTRRDRAYILEYHDLASGYDRLGNPFAQDVRLLGAITKLGPDSGTNFLTIDGLKTWESVWKRYAKGWFLGDRVGKTIWNSMHGRIATEEQPLASLLAGLSIALSTNFYSFYRALDNHTRHTRESVIETEGRKVATEIESAVYGHVTKGGLHIVASPDETMTLFDSDYTLGLLYRLHSTLYPEIEKLNGNANTAELLEDIMRRAPEALTPETYRAGRLSAEETYREILKVKKDFLDQMNYPTFRYNVLFSLRKGVQRHILDGQYQVMGVKARPRLESPES